MTGPRHFADIDAVDGDTLRDILEGAKARKKARAGKGQAAPDAGAPLAGAVLEDWLAGLWEDDIKERVERTTSLATLRAARRPDRCLPPRWAAPAPARGRPRRRRS